MALSQQHRSAIYAAWEPQLGSEVAEALISQFPARDLDEPVTKDFVRAEVSDLRGDMQAEFGKVRGEIQAEFGKVRGEIGDLRTEMLERFREADHRMGQRIDALAERSFDQYMSLSAGIRSMAIWMSTAVAASSGLSAAIVAVWG